MGVVSSSDGRPTQQTYEVYTIVSKELNVQLTQLRRLLSSNLPKINAMLREAGLKEIENKGPIA